MSDFISLLPSNSKPLARNIEKAITRDIPVDIEKIWNPDTCPAAFLPFLAWMLSIDTWKAYWPEAIKREQIKKAIDIQLRKGTTKAVRDVVNSFGTDLAMKEWFEMEPLGVPHTFQVTLTFGADVPDTAEFQQDVINAITLSKAKRSQFTFVIGIASIGQIGFQGVMRCQTYKRLEAIEAPYVGGIGFQGISRTMNYLRLTATEAA